MDAKGTIKSVHIKRVEFRENVRAYVPQVQEKLRNNGVSVLSGVPLYILAVSSNR